jgi:hypothetical protein
LVATALTEPLAVEKRLAVGFTDTAAVVVGLDVTVSANDTSGERVPVELRVLVVVGRTDRVPAGVLVLVLDPRPVSVG